MSVNIYRPHLLILPEDRADREVAVGFSLGVTMSHQVQVLPEAGGWLSVLECFQSDHVSPLERLTTRHMLLVIDFDTEPLRREKANEYIPAHLADRVFVIGARPDPEAVKRSLGRQFEQLGQDIAQCCFEDSNQMWDHPHLLHNLDEIARLRQRVRPFLF